MLRSRALRNNPGLLAAELEPKMLANAYDPRPIRPQKAGVTIGMAMTEKQGGSDLRASTTTRVRPVSSDGAKLALTGHKWFCSAPMSDGFFTLARPEKGVTCFFVPRSLPDGSAQSLLSSSA